MSSSFASCTPSPTRIPSSCDVSSDLSMLRSQLMHAPEALSDSSDLPEILWYFSHLPNESRLVLAQNPHFYADLPTSPAKYVRRFSSQPTEIYHQGMIDVLTNDVRRVFLECHPEPRVFDNVWTINGILIFKGSCVVFLFSPGLAFKSRLFRRFWKARG